MGIKEAVICSQNAKGIESIGGLAPGTHRLLGPGVAAGGPGKWCPQGRAESGFPFLSHGFRRRPHAIAAA